MLFGESQSRIIITCKKDSAAKIEALAKKNSVSCQRIGKVGGKNLKIQGLIDLPLEKLGESWSKGMTRALG